MARLTFDEVVKSISFHVDENKAREIAVMLQQEGALLLATHQPQPNVDTDKIHIWLEICSTENDKLSEWEQRFIASVSEQFDDRGTLTEKQQARIKQIYDKVV